MQQKIKHKDKPLTTIPDLGQALETCGGNWWSMEKAKKTNAAPNLPHKSNKIHQILKAV